MSNKNTIHNKKVTFEDRFARKYYCQRAARDYIKTAKIYNRRKFRRILKKYLIAESEDD